MTNEPGVDHPDVGHYAHLSIPDLGCTLDCRVVQAWDGVLVLRAASELEVPAEAGEDSSPPTRGLGEGPPVLRPGTEVRLSWARVLDRRVVPAVVVEGDDLVGARWRVRTTGPADVGQRRDSVRARVDLPVVVVLDAGPLAATTEDLSEGGARILLDAAVEPPRPGDELEVRLELEGVEVSARAEVVQIVRRDRRNTVRLRFHGLSERDQDRVRRRVFQALREERARLAG